VEIPPLSLKASTTATFLALTNSFHNNTSSVSSKPPDTPYSFILPLMIGEMRLKTSTRTVKDTIKLKTNWLCTKMVRLSHINVSFAAQSNIELRTALTMSLGRVSYNQYSNGISKKTNEGNTKEGNSESIFIRGTIERKRTV
jgi:hypothetical protein